MKTEPNKAMETTPVNVSSSTFGRRKINAWFKKKTPLTKARGREDWPAFVMGRRAILRWIHPDGKHRAYVIARDDGHFMKWSEFFCADEFENCWIPEDMGGSFYDSEVTAIREVHGGFPWTQELQPERRAAEPGDTPIPAP